MYYEVVVAVFNTKVVDDCDVITNAAYWRNEYGQWHPFDREFDSLEEARAYAETFTQDMARRTLCGGNGPLYEHVGIDVVVRHDDDTEDYAVSCYDWKWGAERHAWHNEEVADEALPITAAR